MDVGDLIVINGDIAKYFAIFVQKGVDNSFIPIIFVNTNKFYIGVRKDIRLWIEFVGSDENVIYSKRREKK